MSFLVLTYCALLTLFLGTHSHIRSFTHARPLPRTGPRSHIRLHFGIVRLVETVSTLIILIIIITAPMSMSRKAPKGKAPAASGESMSKAKRTSTKSSATTEEL